MQATLVEESIPKKIKSFWSHVKSLTSSSQIPSNMVLDSTEAVDSNRKCELFSQYFSSVFEVDNAQVPTFYMILALVKLSTIVLLQLWMSKVSWKTLIQTRLLAQIVFHQLSSSVVLLCLPLLTVYFRGLISVGSFPSVLKQSYVVPIFKSGSKHDVRNYRPIAIQPTLAKIYEDLVLHSLYLYFGSFISSPHQHSFIRGRSSATNLLFFHE